MKTRSKALYAYLFEAGVLKGTPEEIDRAKCEYRRQYKKQWKKAKRPRKEIRIEFTIRQFVAIKNKAMEYELRHTPYARHVILSAVGSAACIYDKDRLLKILQLVSMAAIAVEKCTMPTAEISKLLAEAESSFLECLNMHNHLNT